MKQNLSTHELYTLFPIETMLLFGKAYSIELHSEYFAPLQLAPEIIGRAVILHRNQSITVIEA